MRVQIGSTVLLCSVLNSALDGVGGWCDTLVSLPPGRALVPTGGG